VGSAVHSPWKGLLAGWALCAGCAAPHVNSFSATPRVICPATTAVVLRWSVAGSASLSADRAIANLGSCPSSGELTIPGSEFPPSSGTHVFLTASAFFHPPERAEQVIEHAGDAPPPPMGPDSDDVTCDDARREVIAPVAFDASEYDQRIVVTRLRNLSERTVIISHRGRTWTIPSGETIPLLPRAGMEPDPGVLTGGTWILRAPLSEDERCGTPSARPALSIALEPSLACAGDVP